MIPFVKIFGQFNDQYGYCNFSKPMSVHELIKCADRDGLTSLLLDRYFFSNLLKKNPHLTDENPIDETLIDFYDSEKHAARYDDLFFTLVEHPQMFSYLSVWRAQVGLIMGKFYPGKFSVTHGATANCATGQNPIERFKVTQLTSNLSSFIELGKLSLKTCAALPWDTYEIGKGVVDIVPKTSFIGRVIVKPCAGNAFVQRSIGNALSGRLVEEGIDLSYAQDLHRRLAKFASIKGHLTTDDQKWASVLVYRALVQFLVPSDWFEIMDAARDRVVIMPDGSEFALSQFATMGNGFCFELETIIFLGLLRTAAYLKGMHIRHKDIRVFGDDLIYPKELTSLVRSIGKNVGFITNVDKSFSEGYFRESCGGDYLDGQDVRPVHLKGNFYDLYDLTTMCNQLRCLLDKHDWKLPSIKRTYYNMVKHYYSITGRKNVLWGPTNFDGCLHGRPLENCSFSVKDIHGLMYFRTLKKVPKKLISYRELAYKTDVSYLSRMVTAGFAKGHGAIVLPEQSLKPWIFGPPKPLRSIYPRSIPAAGTRYKTAVVEQAYFPFSQPWDSDKPLDVFNHLAGTGCMEHIASNNYFFKRDKALQELRVTLLEKLINLRDQKVADLSKLDRLVIDLE